MARKVLIISSSPRRGGNSDLLCDRFMEGAREAGLEVEKVFLKDLKINYCTGCNRCYNGEHPCPQRDDAAGVLEKMVAADVIVMATPVYFYTVCGQMKTLIDRCTASPFSKRSAGVVVDCPSRGRPTPRASNTSLAAPMKSATFAMPT